MTYVALHDHCAPELANRVFDHVRMLGGHRLPLGPYTRAWKRTSASIGRHGGGRRRIRPRNVVDSGTRINIPASSPGRCRGDHSDLALDRRARDLARVPRLLRRLDRRGWRRDLLRSSPMVGTAGGSELDLRWTLVRVDTSRPVPAALGAAVKPLFIVLGTFAALLIIGYVALITFEWWAWWD